MQKSGRKTEGHHTIFSVLEVKRSNIIFYFIFGSFFGQDHPLNLITLGVYAKGWPKCARISKQKLM